MGTQPGYRVAKVVWTGVAVPGPLARLSPTAPLHPSPQVVLIVAKQC